MAQRNGQYLWRCLTACAAACALLVMCRDAGAQLIANSRPAAVERDGGSARDADASIAEMLGPPVGALEASIAVEGAADAAPAPAEEPVRPAQETRSLGGVDARSEADGETAPGAAQRPGLLGGGFVRGVGSLALVIGLIIGAWLIVKKLMGSSGALIGQLGPGGRAPSGLLTVLGRYPVARGQTLVLLKLDQRILLLSQTTAGFRTLAELTDPEEVASILVKARDEEGDTMAHRFRSLLKSAERDPAFASPAFAAGAGPTTVRGAWAQEAAPCNGPLPFGPDAADAEEGGADAASALRRRLHSLRGRTA